MITLCIFWPSNNKLVVVPIFSHLDIELLIAVCWQNHTTKTFPLCIYFLNVGKPNTKCTSNQRQRWITFKWKEFYSVFQADFAQFSKHTFLNFGTRFSSNFKTVFQAVFPQFLKQIFPMDVHNIYLQPTQHNDNLG